MAHEKGALIKLLIHLVVGARPNFVKIAPLYRALEKRAWARVRLVHTGQHSSYEMSGIFLKELGLRKPHILYKTRKGTHAEITARVMVAYEKDLEREKPGLVVVAGDVNSTLACALAAKKQGVPLAHLEAGLRSGDRTMPEEINRLAVDAISDILWPPSKDAENNLLSEGVSRRRITCVGNAMIDSLVHAFPKIKNRHPAAYYHLEPKRFITATFHRPTNVDGKKNLSKILTELRKVSRSYPVIFPVHPRTKQTIQEQKQILRDKEAKLIMVEPYGYLDFLALLKDSLVVLTDSGGIQEETSFLGIPCLTVRENTERPITVLKGTNQLIKISEISKKTLAAAGIKQCPCRIPLWDGHASERIIDDLKKRFKKIVK